MKTIIIFILTLFFTVEIFAVGLSAPTNGVYLAVVGWTHFGESKLGPNTNEIIPFDSQLGWLPFSNTGMVRVWFPSEPAYLAKVKMFDSDGKEVSKTSVGKSFGSKWSGLHDYRDAKCEFVFARGSYQDNRDLGGCNFLSTPKELFKMKKPGIYTMEIEMQMFRYVATTNVDEWSRNLIHFSPIKIKVEKPPDN